MLTSELLKNIAGLTDEQVSAIVKMSENDENVTIAKKTREIYDSVDSVISEVTGQTKGQTEKTTDLLKRAVGAVKTDMETLRTKNEELTKQISEGKGDDQIKQQLKDQQDKYKQLETLYNSDKESFAKEVAAANDKYKGALIGFEFQKAAAEIALNPDLPEVVRKTMLDAAISKISTSYKPELTDTGMVFRNAEGALVTNPKNNLNPFNAKELLSEQLKDILATDPKSGGGTNPGKAAPTAFNAASYKTQVELMDGIEKHLSAKGMVFGTEAYQNEVDKIWAETDVTALPLK